MKKEEAKKPIKEGEMAFDDDKEESKEVPPTRQPGQPARLFSAMTIVYGGPADPFELPDSDGLLIKRFEAIEKRIQEERLNTHIFVYQDKQYNFQPKLHDRIIMTDDDIRK